MARRTGRIVFSLAGASFGAVVVALVEAHQTARAVAGGHAPGYAELAAGDVGVLGPVAAAVGFAVSAAALFLEPERPLTPTERIAALQAQPVLARSRTAAIALLACISAAAWLIATAQFGRIALAAGAPTAAGGALAVTSLVALGALGAVGLAVLPSVRSGLASVASRWPRAIDPATTCGVGLVVGAAVVGLGVAAGDAGGTEPGPWRSSVSSSGRSSICAPSSTWRPSPPARGSRPFRSAGALRASCRSSSRS